MTSFPPSPYDDPMHDGSMQRFQRPQLLPEGNPDEDTEPFLVPDPGSALAFGDVTPSEDITESGRTVEDLTIAEALRGFFRAPRRTIFAITDVAMTPRDNGESALTNPPLPAYVPPRVTRPPTPAYHVPTLPVEQPDIYAYGATASSIDYTEIEPRPRSAARDVAQLALRVAALLAAWVGSMYLASAPNRNDNNVLLTGLSTLGFGLLIWWLSESMGRWWRVPGELPRPRGELPRSYPLQWGATEAALRIILVIVGIVSTILTWGYTAGNRFTPLGFAAWMVSIFAWFTVLAPVGWSYTNAARKTWIQIRQTHLRDTGTLIALVCIMALGTYFRVHDFSGTPPEMTSDHVEKLLDANRVTLGETSVFFANNGGREPAQMYFLALLTQLPGVEMNFDALKLITVIEGLITLPVLWWLGRELLGKEDRRLGNLLGLALAALVAASYWHTALSRLGLRIVLTSLVAALLLMFLARAMRWNRREDFLKAGLVLGFGLYMYQAVRLLPIVVVIGVVLALLFRARTMAQRRTYLVNLSALVMISAVVFVPMARYIYESPEEFMRRTSGRLFGDDVTQARDEQGNLVARTPTLEERLTAFNANMPVLVSNIRNALLMFHWRGDIAWINGAPNRPAMDPIAGALLAVGIPAWLALTFRRRDPTLALVPIMVFIMLLPSALSIAYPIENPSATRASGALPAVYLIAALPLALLARSIMRLVGGRAGAMTAFTVAGAIVVGSYVANAETYFNDFRSSYVISSLPYSVPGERLRDFAENEGSYGNAFMIAFPYWWDHRAVGIEGGVMDWPNGVLSYERLPDFLFLAAQRVGEYAFDPEKPMLFFYSPEDNAAMEQLQEWFPEGRTEEVTTYQPEDRYRVFTAPALGTEGFAAWLAEFAQPSS